MARMWGPLFVCLVLTSCTSDPSSSKTEWASAQMFQAAQLNWLVVDRPDKTMLLIQHDHFAQRSPPRLPRSTHEQAAAAFLTSKGPRCQLLAGSGIEPTILSVCLRVR